MDLVLLNIPNFGEGFLVYKSYQGIQELPSTIAHEALHAFGALDLYVDPMFAKNKNKKMSRQLNYGRKILWCKFLSILMRLKLMS